MKMFKYYVLLPLVVVIGVTKAQNCTNSTTVECCVCPEEQCDSCPSGYYRLDPPYPSDTGCSLESTTPSPSSSTDAVTDTNTTPSRATPTAPPDGGPFSQNAIICMRNCPSGFYGNNETSTCLKCPDGCGNCTDNSTCIDCIPGFENTSGICSLITTTTPGQSNTTLDNDDNDETMYYIIGGVCGGVVLIAIVIIIIVVVVCRKRKQARLLKKRKRTFTEKLEAIHPVPADIESTVQEAEVRPTTDHHIYENTAQITKGFSQKIYQGHDKVLRYTPDPTQSIKLGSSRDNELSEVDQLPEAPAPPIPKPKPSKRPTKAKKSNSAPPRDDVYEPVESVEPVASGQNDTGGHVDGEDYENELVMKQMKSVVRKKSFQVKSDDHQEDDYENDQVVKDFKVDSKPEVEHTPEVDTEQEYENDEELERLRKQDAGSKLKAEPEPEHELQDYENETEIEMLRKREAGSKFRKPTKDPLVDEELYENL